MSAISVKKPNVGVTFPAAVLLFEQLTALFASPSAKKLPHISLPMLEASFLTLRDAPEVERAAVSAVLKELANRLTLLLEPGAADDAIDADAADSKFKHSLAGTFARKPAPTVAQKSKSDGAAFMERMRQESSSAMLARIADKEVLTSTELQDALKIRRQSISEARKSGRMFALIGPSGENFYPAFYADPALDRRAVEQVSKTLGLLPGASKYQFFTNRSHMLGATPLEALKKGRLAEVLAAAAGFAER